MNIPLLVTGCGYLYNFNRCNKEANCTNHMSTTDWNWKLMANRRGGLVVTLWPITLATRVRFPVRAVRRKSVRVSEVIFFISRLQPSKPDTGVYKRDWWGRANYLCSHCFLWPGTIMSLWKPSPGQTDQLHTLQHSPHTCIHKWRGHNREICTPPLKKK